VTGPASRRSAARASGAHEWISRCVTPADERRRRTPDDPLTRAETNPRLDQNGAARAYSTQAEPWRACSPCASSSRRRDRSRRRLGRRAVGRGGAELAPGFRGRSEHVRRARASGQHAGTALELTNVRLAQPTRLGRATDERAVRVARRSLRSPGRRLGRAWGHGRAWCPQFESKKPGREAVFRAKNSNRRHHASRQEKASAPSQCPADQSI